MALTGKNISLPIYHDVEGVRTPFHDLVLHKFVVDSVVMSLGDKITGDVYYKDSDLECSMQEYVVFNDIEYRLISPPTQVKEGLVKDNSELHGMTKYSFEFYHPMHILGNLPFTDVAVSYDDMRYKSQDKVFSWIGKPADFVAKLNKNLENTEWVVVLSSKFPQGKLNELSEVMPFNDNTIADVLKMGYDTWETPFVVDKLHESEYYHTVDNNDYVDYYDEGKRFVVVFGLPSNEIYENELNELANIPFVFKFGQGLGLKNNSRTPRNNKIVTRIAGYGSENNIPYGYPQIRWYGDPNATCTIGDSVGAKHNVTINGVTHEWAMSYPIYEGIVGGEYVKLIKHPFTRNHLMPSVYVESIFNKVSQYLPNGNSNTNYNPTLEIKDYYDAVEGDNDYPYTNLVNLSAPSYEIKEFEKIKPELGEALILGVTPINDDLTDASSWDDTMDDDGNYLQSYFKITLPQLDFDLYACAAITQEMQINMRSGACIGCTFTVQVDWDDYKRNFYDSNLNFLPNGSQRDLTKYPNSANGSITLIVQKDINTFGTLMPNIYQNPHAGDAFVILGISLPVSYITSAQSRLDAEMKSYMLENNVHYFDYPLKFDECFLANYTNVLNQIRPNTVIRFEFNETILELYVKQLTIKFNESTLPQYDITLTDNIEVVLNQIGQVAEDVQHLGTLISLLRQQGLKGASTIELAKKLSRVDDDAAQGLITFLRGLNVGEFSRGGGLLGSGASIDEDGNAEFNSIISREFISTPEFRFNRVFVTEGEQWNTNGFGTIERVDTENHRIYLHVEDGDTPSIRKFDICRGIYNNVGYSVENETEEYDLSNQPEIDDCQFPTKPNFFTSYFWVTNDPVLVNGVWSFTYETKGEYDGTDDTPHPCKNMKFAQYGNFVEIGRQSSLYQTSIRHSYIQQLEGVNNWVILPQNIASRYGYLQDLTVLLKRPDGTTYTQTLNGSGLYVQDNVYFGNATLQLDPVTIQDLKDQLKNYSVQLSEYTDIINVDDTGTVIGGLWTESGSGHNISRQYKIFTAITVRNGVDLLTIDTSESITAPRGKFKVHVYPHGCSYLLDGNSTLYITGIDNINNGVNDNNVSRNSDWYETMRSIEKVSVDLFIDCENVGTIVQTVPITIRHDSLPYIIADLTNENAAISWKSSGYIGLPIETKINMAKGNENLSIGNIEIVSINGYTPTWSGFGNIDMVTGNFTNSTSSGWTFSWNVQTGIVKILSAPFAADDVTEILIQCSTTYAGVTYTRTLSLHITRVVGLDIWDVVPTHETITYDRNSRFNFERVGVEVYCTNSSGKQLQTQLPIGFTLKYKITTVEENQQGNLETVVGNEIAMSLNDTVNVNDSSYNATISKITFTLYNASGGYEDSEEVPIIRDGTGGQGSSGQAGNGISAITTYYLRTRENVFITNPLSLPSSGCDGTWNTNLVTPNSTWKWLWSYTVYTYTSQSPYTTQATLLSIYPSAPNVNILDDTSFLSDYSMGAWYYKGLVSNDPEADPSSSSYDSNEYNNFFGVVSGTQGRNAYCGIFKGQGTGDGASRYVILLQQFIKDSTINKITQGEWYTLSFMAKGSGTYSVGLRGYMVQDNQHIETDFVDLSIGIIVDDVTRTDNQHSITFKNGSSSDWVLHTITFKVIDNLNVDNCYIQWAMRDTTTQHEIAICMPKLEIGMSATAYLDGESSAIAFPRQGEWESEKLYYAGNPGESFIDAVIHNGYWFKCIKSHVSSSANSPSSVNWKTYWKQASYSGFTATGLFLADVAYINNLGARLLRTGESNHPHVEMFDSIVRFFGRGEHPSIELGVDDDGVALLNFFDKNGLLLYNLGPKGLNWINVLSESFIAHNFVEMTNGYDHSESSSDSVILRQFNAKRIKGIVYGDSTYTNNNQQIAEQADGLYFTGLSVVVDGNLNTSQLANGLYRELPSTITEFSNIAKDGVESLISELVSLGLSQTQVENFDWSENESSPIPILAHPVKMQTYCRFSNGVRTNEIVFWQ